MTAAYNWPELVAIHRERAHCNFDGETYRSHTCLQATRKPEAYQPPAPSYRPMTQPDTEMPA